MNFLTTKTNFDLRRELRLALLAAMETCWVYAALIFIAVLMRVPTFAAPLMLFFVYWVALILGRELPRRKEPWVALQAAAVLVAVILGLLTAWIELYRGRNLLDLNWIADFFKAIVLRQDFSRVAYTTAAVVYMFVRGLGFGSRPLTLWFVGFQFRLGVVVYFGVLVASAFWRPLEISPWIFIYFALSLFSIALARMDELGADLRPGPRWTLILCAGVALVFFLGFALLQVFTLESASAFLKFFSPLALVAQALLLLIAIPAGILAEWLVMWLRPLLAQLDQFLQGMQLPQLQNFREELEKNIQPDQPLAFLIPLLQTAAILLILFWIGNLIARALRKRMQQADDALYVREALESEDDATRAKRELGSKKQPAPRRAGDFAAASIRRIYAALTARASDAGVPRRDAETPYEFQPRLMKEWQDQSDPIREITEAYVAVHYGEREASPEEVGKVKAAWERIKRKTENK